MTTTFRKGDRVRSVSDSSTGGIAPGREYVLTATGSTHVHFRDDNNDGRMRLASRYELVQSQATGPSPIVLSTLKPGDKVTLAVTVEVTAEADCDGDVRIEGHSIFGDYLYRRTSYVGTVEHAPRPLVVGDRVRSPRLTATGKIEAVLGDRAWVSFPNLAPRTERLAALTRA